MAIAADPAGNVYFSSGLCVIRLDRAGVMTRFAGKCTSGFSGDGGPATEAQLSANGLAFDSGNLYIADGANRRVRKVANGIITTVAGSGAPVVNSGGGGDGGPAVNAQLGFPGSVAVDSAGNLYIGGQAGLRKVLLDGTITTIGKNDIGYP